MAKPPPEIPFRVVPKAPKVEEASSPARPRKTPKPTFREGKRAFTFYASEEAWEQLTVLQARQRKTRQAILEEALEGLFEKYRQTRIR